MKFIAALFFALVLFVSPAKAATGRIAVLSLNTTVEARITTPLSNAIEEINEKSLADGIVLEINSYGGSIDDGLVLAKAIERSRIPVVCVVDGEAHSMASYILEACPKRAMTKRSLLMIHQPIIPAHVGGGQLNQWKSSYEYILVLTKAFSEHYGLHMQLSSAEIFQRIDGGKCWYLGWEDALKFHAVDLVVDSFNEIFPKN
jgi:ATP-dependent protease ClpP protease subunit